MDFYSVTGDFSLNVTRLFKNCLKNIEVHEAILRGRYNQVPTFFITKNMSVAKLSCSRPLLRCNKYLAIIPNTLVVIVFGNRVYKKKFSPSNKKHIWTPRSACPYFKHIHAVYVICWPFQYFREYNIVFCDQLQCTFVSCVSHATAFEQTFTATSVLELISNTLMSSRTHLIGETHMPAHIKCTMLGVGLLLYTFVLL